MKYKYARYTSLLNKITKKDPLFFGDYTLDPYQNCEFGCKYCDSTLDETVYIKTNAVQLLKKELKNIPKGTIIIGSVSDPYQKAEKKYNSTRGLLEIIRQHDFPCHILTKSNLILRDIDLLSKMKNCIVTISLITLDEKLSGIFEKNVPSSMERLQTAKKLSGTGIKTGIAIMPLLPFITEGELENIVKLAKQHEAQYVLHKHLELKGDQKNIFMKTLKKSFPNLVEKYEKLYRDRYRPDDNYISRINNTMNKLYVTYNIKNKIIL